MKAKLPYFATEPWVVIPLAVLGLVASMSPDAPFLDHFEEIVRLQSLLFPPISAYARQSDFPRVMSVCMAFSFALMPIHFWFGFKHLRCDKGESWHKSLWAIDSWIGFCQRFALFVVLFFAVVVGLFLNPGYDFNLLPINTSTAALALGGSLLGGAGAAWCLAWVVATLIALLGFLKEKFR